MLTAEGYLATLVELEIQYPALSQERVALIDRPSPGPDAEFS